MRNKVVNLAICSLLSLSVEKPLFAATVTWNGLNSSSDLNTNGNWLPTNVPTSGDVAAFDSTVPNINTTPKDANNFNVSSIDFLNSADSFTFTFDQSNLTLGGAGITGGQTNTTINVNNTNNSTTIATDQVTLSGLTSTTGSAALNITNSGTLSGSVSGVTLSKVTNDQLNAAINSYSIASNGSLNVSNTGNDSSTGNGGNFISVATNQMEFTNSAILGDLTTLGDNVTITGNNSGTFTGTNAVTGQQVGRFSNDQLKIGYNLIAGDSLNINLSNIGLEASPNSAGGNLIGDIASNQLFAGFNFTAGNNASITLENKGTFSSSSNGNTLCGHVGNDQIDISQIFEAGDTFTLNISNTGINSGSGSSLQVGDVAADLAHFNNLLTVGNQANFIMLNQGTISGTGSSCDTGYVIGDMLYVGQVFQAGDDLTINLKNIGVDSSSGNGLNQTGYVNNLINFVSNINLGSNASIVLLNEGINSSSSMFTSNIGYVANSMMVVNNGALGQPFTAGDYLTISLTNTGNDSSSGGGFYNTGYVGSPQLILNKFTAGNHATINLSNSGTFSGTSNTNRIGYVQLKQFRATGVFQAGDYFTINATNSGNDSDTGTGLNQVGVLAGQVEYDSALTLGNFANINLSNSGIGSGIGTYANSSVGYLSTGSQFGIYAPLSAGDYFYIKASNSGQNSVNGTGNKIGVIADPQINFNGDVVVGNNASFITSNSGLIENGGNTSQTGNVTGSQIVFGSIFSAGNNLSISLTNQGTDSSAGAGNTTGQIQSNQLSLSDTFMAGNNASISISNSGFCNSSSSTNSVALVSGDQLAASGAFVVGNDLSINVSNSAQSISLSQVGVVNSQINFYNMMTMGDGAQLIASNLGSGTVLGSQINFQDGFNLTGKATFQATNQGTLNGYGIFVGGSTSGGDINVILGNSSLNVQSSSPTFTIGQLNGDSSSFVQSLPTLIIDTDPKVKANFAGTILNYPATVSTLVKTGVGTQTLSGNNRFTGLTQVEQGTLIVNGSLAGPANVLTPGILMGTGSIAGTVTNSGIIAPGNNNIGQINFLAGFTNNNGGYDVEVNGAGFSDLINVTGTAQLNGGPVVVTSSDGTYQFHNKYTILTAGSVNGKYSSVSALSSLIIPKLTYDSQHVYLTLLTDFASAAKTHNQKVVALQLDGITDPSAAQSLVLNELLGLSTNSFRNSLDSLSGAQHTADIFATQSINRQFIRRLYDPIRTIVTTEPNNCGLPWFICTPCNTLQAWFEAGGTFIRLDGNQGINGFNSNGYEVTGGLQKTFYTNWTLGVAGSYEHDDLQFRHGVGKEKSDTWFVGLYGLYRPSCFYGLVDFAYGDSSNKLNRSIDVGSLHYQATSKPKSYQFTFYGEAGVDLNLLKFLIQPFFGIEAGSYHRNHLQENSFSGFALDVQKRDRALASTRLGLHLTKDGIWQNWVTVSIDAAWNRLLTKSVNHIDEGFVEFGTPFSIYGQNFNRDSIDYALTLTAPVSGHFSGYIEASGESWSRVNVFNILGGIEYSW